jgi:hypothetical protein
MDDNDERKQTTVCRCAKWHNHCDIPIEWLIIVGMASPRHARRAVHTLEIMIQQPEDDSPVALSNADFFTEHPCTVN